MKCHEAQEQLSAYIDGMLSTEEREAVEMHLKSCPECQEEYQLLRNLVETLHSMPKESMEESFTKEVCQKIKEQEIKGNIKTIAQRKRGNKFSAGGLYKGLGVFVAMLVLFFGASRIFEEDLILRQPQILSNELRMDQVSEKDFAEAPVVMNSFNESSPVSQSTQVVMVELVLDSSSLSEFMSWLEKNEKVVLLSSYLTEVEGEVYLEITGEYYQGWLQEIAQQGSIINLQEVQDLVFNNKQDAEMIKLVIR